MPFTKFGLAPSLLRNVQALGYTAPTPIQEQSILPIRSGRDMLATAQTGTGKTAAFLLPVLHQLLDRPRGSTGALVLTPTRELAQQILGCFRGLSAGTPLRGSLVIGGVAEGPQERDLRAGLDLVVATPGRLLQHLRNRHSMPGLKTLILDEADQMFDLGFLPDVKRILSFLPQKRQTLLFSATMPPDVERLGRAILSNPLTVSIGTQGKPADTVDQVVYAVPAHRKTALLEHLLEQWEEPSVLVFTRTRRGAKRLAKALYTAGHRVEELHSDCSATQRTRAMQAFRDRKVPILVATNIAARGIDVRHITHVVSYDAPAAPEEYVHRIGRTGRAGDAGEAIVMMSPEESDIVTRIERQLRKRLPRHRVEDFDYDAPPREAPRSRPAPGNPRPAGKPRPVVAAAGPRGWKPKRGRGRR